MLLVNEKIKFAAKKDAPNPKEVTYWIDLTEDPEGRCWKYFDAESNRWVTFLLGNQEGTLDAYSKAESDEKYATNTALEDLAEQLDAKQDKLISEQTIKTINGQSVLGSGNIQIDRGLNQNQVQDLIDESTKDFITVDETHEYVQDELNKIKLIVLNPELIPARVKDIIDGEEIDFNTVKDELSEIGYNLLYVDPYNGMYRITYREVDDSILYVHTTEKDGKFIEERKIYSNDNTYEYRKLTHSITIDNRENYDRGIVVSVNDGNIDTSITLINQGNGGKYLANDGTYKPMGCPNLYTAKDRLPDCLAVLLDDDEIEINRFIEAKEYLTELNGPVYLVYTDVYNESVDSRTIDGNQLYSFYYDSVSDSIFIVGSIDPLYQIYNTNNPQPRTTEVTQITNTAQIIRRRISDGVYGDNNGFSIRLEDNKFDSVNNPDGSTISRYINLYTEGNGKDVLFNDGLYRNLQNSIDFSNYLGKDNTTPYTPTGDYHPATKKYVDDEIAGLVDSAPEALDTLNELAAALNDNPNFATDIINLIGTKADQSIIGDVNNLTTTNKTVVGAINEHETLINANATNISNLTNTVNQHTSQISTINSNISNLTSTVNNQQTTINSHTSSINNINSQITNILNGSSLPIASATQLGAVKIGSGVNVTAQGVISVDTVTWDNISGKPSTFYTLPVATTTTLGGIKQGSWITVASDGTMSVNRRLFTDGTNFSLGTGTSGSGVAVGRNITTVASENFGFGDDITFTTQYQWAIGIQPYLDNTIVGAIGLYCRGEAESSRANMFALNKLAAGTTYQSRHGVYVYGVGGYNGGTITSSMKPIDVVIDEISQTSTNDPLIVYPFTYTSQGKQLPTSNKWEISYSELTSSFFDGSDIEGAVSAILTFGQGYNWLDSDFQDPDGLPIYYAHKANTPKVSAAVQLGILTQSQVTGTITQTVTTVEVPFVKLLEEEQSHTDIVNNTGTFDLKITATVNSTNTGIDIVVDETVVNWVRQYKICLYPSIIFLAIKQSKAPTNVMHRD